MDLPENVGGRDRLARALLAVVLTIAAIRSLRNGKRLRALLAGIGALVFGFNATTKYCGVNDELNIDTTGDGVTVEFEDTTDETAVETEHAATAETTVSSDAEIETAATAGRGRTLVCGACGEPIVPGQNRGPNEHDEIVHDDCA